MLFGRDSFRKKNMGKYIIPYILSYAFLMPIALGKSFQYSSCYYVMIIASVLLLKITKNFDKKAKNLVK